MPESNNEHEVVHDIRKKNYIHENGTELIV